MYPCLLLLKSTDGIRCFCGPLRVPVRCVNALLFQLCYVLLHQYCQQCANAPRVKTIPNRNKKRQKQQLVNGTFLSTDTPSCSTASMAEHAAHRIKYVIQCSHPSRLSLLCVCVCVCVRVCVC